MDKNWSTRAMPSLDGRRAIVTGANSGIGYHTALELARAGAEVLLAVRDAARGEEALARLRQELPAGRVAVASLDLASLASVSVFAERELAGGRPLHLLINNAGVMAIPTRELTADGFERQLGTNHLGHFALTGLLLPLLQAAPSPRVVNVSSSVAWFGRLDLGDLQSERRYTPMGAYGQSKIANLLFTVELQRRGEASGLTSVAAHPGAAQTNLQRHAFAGFVRFVGQSAAEGALPSLYAAVGEVEGGRFYGPRRHFGMHGPPGPAWQPKKTRDPQAAAALWVRSEDLTGVRYSFAPIAASHASRS
jgi:NAD(P)-dependent dehydrogenase (short-subunit alcohol dehydrogenase family)